MPRSKINQQIRNYPNIMDKFNSYDGMDDQIDYDEELYVPEWEEI